MKMPTVNEWATPGAGSQNDAMPSYTLPKCKTLREAPLGCSARVFSVQASSSFASRLHSLGFVPGVPLRVVNRHGNASLIVEILRSRLSLSAEAARAITVRVS